MDTIKNKSDKWRTDEKDHLRSAGQNKINTASDQSSAEWLDKLVRRQTGADTKTHVGIDTGTDTGIAVTKGGKFELIKTMKIHRAMKHVEQLAAIHGAENICVRIEDARLRKWYGGSGREKLQGAGSVKRDAVIWQDFLSDLKVKAIFVAPKNNRTKLSVEQFVRMTGWKGRTSEHSRDAAMLVIGL